MSRWKIIKGNIPIIFIAAHNYPHVRKNKLKKADINTSSLASSLAMKLSAYAMYSTAIQEDPNWYINSDFRKHLKKYLSDKSIGVAFDLHGRRKNWPNLIEFFPNDQFKNKYSNAIKDEIIKDFVEDDQLTICEDLPIPGLQLEIRRDGRDPSDKNHLHVVQKIVNVTKVIINLENWNL